jgi:hypothetical protein
MNTNHALLTVAFFLTACGGAPPGTKDACETSAHCLEGNSCVAGTCVPGTCDSTQGMLSAKEAVELANVEAQKWAPDAAILSLHAMNYNSAVKPPKPVLGTDGKLLLDENAVFEIWYVSKSKGEISVIDVYAPGFVKVGAASQSAEVNGPVAGDEWIDSGEAIRVAEKNGGCSFRGANPGMQVRASLMAEWKPGEGPVWAVMYQVPDVEPKLIVFLNARTGELIQATN